MTLRFTSLLQHRIFASVLVLLSGALCCSSLQSAAQASKPLASLKSHVGQEPYDLFKSQPLHRRLVALLGAEYPSFVTNMNPASPLEEQNGILHTEGNAPHRGGEEEAVLLIDVENDTLEVFLRHKETIVRAWAEHQRTVVLPHDVMERLKNWPRPALAQALAGLQQAAGPRSGSVASRPDPASQAGSARGAAFTPTPKLCQSGSPCEEVNSFAATITDFRTSATDRYKLLTATVRITNKLSRPLILGLVQGSGVGIDDQGNRYTVNGESNVRGIGLITSSVDTKFTLQPGESGDARIEFALQMAHNQIYGTSYEASMTLREIDPVGVGQFRMGREHEIRFTNLVNRLSGRSMASAASATNDSVSSNAGSNASANSGYGAVQPVATNSIPAPVGDACGGAPRCYSAGLFTATVAQLTASQLANNARNHLLRMDIKFRNISTQPIILAYAATTSTAIDNLGNSYYWGRAGTHDVSVQGMGIAESQKVDPHFVLAPGETRNATFQILRFNPGRTQLGTSFTYSVTIQQLEILPSQQIRTVRDYSMNFPDLTANGGLVPNGQGVNDAIKRLGDMFKKK